MRKKIFFLLWCCCCSFEVGAVTLSQQLAVEIGVFDAADVAFSYKEQDNSFHAKADILTTHTFDAFYPFHGLYESWGKITPAILPQLYQTYTKSRHHVRQKKIFYNPQGKAYKRLSIKDNQSSEKEIKPLFVTAHAADAQTILAELIHHFQYTNSCALVREIYDGKKHYKVFIKDMGLDTRFFEFNAHTEPARLCLVYFENLKDDDDDIMSKIGPDNPIKLWLGRHQQTKMPFVLEIGVDSTPLGALKVLPKTLELK
ncbi:MAG: DUF3108 domain-containing protein [Alphaproteobacteria bacterium]|nr:DUF3108 domain-containing protein [Alphaproteobacteria bacterium]